MKINFSQIYEGWKNNLFPADDMKEHIRQISQERMAICDACEWCSERNLVGLINIVHIVDVFSQPRLSVCLVLVP